MDAVSEFSAYCKANDMQPDGVGSMAFYANSVRLREHRRLTTEEWNDILDFVEPDVPPTACSLGHYSS